VARPIANQVGKPIANLKIANPKTNHKSKITHQK